MTIRPTGSNVLVSRIAGAKETESGIILKSSQEPDKAKVLGIGPEVEQVSVDEIALVNWNAARKVSSAGDPEELYIIAESEIVLVYEVE